MDFKTFEEKAREVHGDLYKYTPKDDLKYSGKIEMECTKHGGIYYQDVGNHLAGKVSCKECRVEKRREARKMSEGDFKKILGDRYVADYTEYKNFTTPITLTCTKHGTVFENTLAAVSRGSEVCSECYREVNGYVREPDFSEFLRRAQRVHGDSYEYNGETFKHMSNPYFEIYCPEHDTHFTQIPRNHLKGSTGCKYCYSEKVSGILRGTFEEFLDVLPETHRERFDYHRGDYLNRETPTRITCRKHGLDFWQSPQQHVKAVHACPKCLEESQSTSKLTTESVIEGFVAVHGDRFDYTEFTYLGSSETSRIRCKRHDHWFEQSSASHLVTKHCCPKCRQEDGEKGLYNNEEIKGKFLSLYGDRFDYSQVDYQGYFSKVKIRCVEHDEMFLQTPDNHISGRNGCKKCSSNGISLLESDLFEFVQEMSPHKVLRNDRTMLGNGYELDIVIPEIKLAIEFNGTYYHSDKMKDKNYHKMKKEMADKAGYDLIFVWEFDWNDERKQKVIKEMLTQRVAGIRGKPIRASKLTVKVPTRAEKASLLNNHHIQGDSQTSTICLGLCDKEGEFKSVATFKKKGEGVYELTRYASSEPVNGGFSRLLKNFIKMWEPTTIETFSDIQHFSGDMYGKCGFTPVKTLVPDYKVFHPKTGILFKSNWRRKKIPHMLKRLGKEDLNFNPDKSVDGRSESDMQDACNALRVWDCGKIKWVYEVT